jgi:hypothetical protein
VGSEVQYRWDAGYAYTLVDYDVFYEELNNIMLISNFRYNEQWDFNLNLGYGYSPSLSTVNALYGQTADSIKELEKTLSNDQIYQLARDRTSRAANLYFGSTYQIDTDRQLYFDLSVFSLNETETSDGVLKTPQTNDVQLSMDYSVNGFFGDNDYTSLGFKIRNSDQSESQSAQLRSRFPGYLDLIYDPRFRLERRKVKDTGVDQYILNPSMKLIYRATKHLNFETDLGIEYSDLDLPDLNRQIAYTVYMGYTYFF